MINARLAPWLICYLAAIAIVSSSGSLCAADKKPLPQTLLGKKLVFSDDFESSDTSRWQPTDKTAWKLEARGDNHIFSLIKKDSDYKPPVRSPLNRNLIKDLNLGSFVLDVKLQSTTPDYGHRDMCLFFGYQDDSHLYYVHLGKKMDPHANNIFIVNGEPRKSISTKTTEGTNWDDEWHHARVVRDVATGTIDVFFDDMKNPVMTAKDQTFKSGRVGLGTFDDTGNYDDVLVYGDVVTALQSGPPLAGTQPLTITEPLHEVMVSGIDRFALKALQNSPNEREARWHRDYSSPDTYAKSIAENRERFRKIIGAVDERAKDVEIEVIKSIGTELASLAESDEMEVIPVRWRVLENVTAEGLLLNPKSQPLKGRVVAIPDADWTPETFTGDPNSPKASMSTIIPVRLAQSGIQVIVPTLISRDDTFSGNPDVAMTNQPHREFVYRMAFQMGRHIIGYEVQKVLAAVDAFTTLNRTSGSDVPIGVVGVGEGGQLALYSAALDPRIDAALVSGYFQKREGLWEEPIYRNVWSLLTEFGDAEIASMIAPRPLLVEASSVPEISGPPAIKSGRRGGAAPGRIVTANPEDVTFEYDRAVIYFQKLRAGGTYALSLSGDGTGPAGSERALAQFAKSMGIELANKPAANLAWTKNRTSLADAERQKRQFDELVEFTQELLEHSAKKRDKYFPNEARASLEKWAEVVEKERKYVWEEMIGKLPAPTMPPNVRTRKIIDDSGFTAYEVMLDVYPDVVAGGVLLLPKDLREGEKRPVVVCQHGLEGTPMSTISAKGQGKDHDYYKSFSVELCKRGFITYAPQNPYIGADKFRTIQRKSNPMKRSLFSYIIRQHERTLEWLSTLPNVDPQRIGFYGLSYGGKTAVRVPTMLPQYALSICSADFNEWIRKNVSSDDGHSYMFTPEYEMFEWNMGHTANYAELSMLMTPRPFMVERGHADGVAPDEWVAWEYAKVRRHYVQLGIGDRTEIEFFNGPHSINGVGTFAFLHKHLKWPASTSANAK